MVDLCCAKAKQIRAKCHYVMTRIADMAHNNLLGALVVGEWQATRQLPSEARQAARQ
jgi:hypothetical protein